LPSPETRESGKAVGVPTALGARERKRDPAGPGGEKKEEILAKIGGLQAR